MAFDAAPEMTRYEDVPVYRRRWCYMLLLLFLTPVGILIALTGDVYAMRNNAVMKYPASSRVMTAIGFGFILLSNLSRMSG